MDKRIRFSEIRNCRSRSFDTEDRSRRTKGRRR